ncbi:helix-turn-helix transcriptional regulator [Marivita geojedonensis]|uniref:LuxR family transcriptional regulator n=1 Tax=Marivita geojedonensis TaxID=1123756 RepID=A0A1X4NM25_9RHOB|nr:helix-turn-helix transcriptional regulator [Marivita geojedonensis]OSQ51388.1 LuxR family transcriptional regulator [Marivita geojedonensis]PRY77950.1 regulatory LuxR family protein [Marivita geojedonensis]
MKVWIVLIPLGALQMGSGLFLLWDILGSILGISSSPIAWVYYELAQIGAVIGLILGMVVSAVLMLRSIRRQRAAEESLRLASGAFMDVLQERFAEWELTPAEKDVALFSIKGLSTADIAGLRNTSEGTVKAQTNAIYRKAGVSGRPQLLSLFIEELMGEPIAVAPPSDTPQVIEKAS